MPTFPPGRAITEHNFHGIDGDTEKCIQPVTPGDLGASHGSQQLLLGQVGLVGVEWW